MKSYLRFLSRNKLYTAIKIVGLSLALAFVIPLINIIVDKNERCRAHERHEDIYVVAYSGNLYTDVNFGDYLKERMSEVEHVSSAIINSGSTVIVDHEFFHFFPFEFIEGNESFLDSRNNVAISEKYARTISEESPIGRSLRLDGQEYNIAAVFKSQRNDILKECEILQSIAQHKEFSLSGGIAEGVTFVALPDDHDRQSAEQMILEIADEYNQGNEIYLKMKEYGVTRKLFRYDELPEALENYGQFMQYRSGAMLFIYIIIGLIFIVAVLNYINLNVAVSTSRARESATRKLVGASRNQLIIKGLTESLAFTLICFLFGYLMSGHVGSFIKGLLAMTGFTDFSCEPTGSVSAIVTFVFLIVITAFVAGITPSVISSRFTPLEVTKGDLRYHSKKRWSKFFIGFQTILSVILISVVLMISTCYRKALEVDFNCDIEEVGYIRTMNDMAPLIVAKAAEYPEIISVGLASQVPAEGFSGAITTLDNEQLLFSNIACDSNGFDTFGFEILEQYTDDIHGLWITPYTQSFMQRDSILIHSIFNITKTDHIAGIINDFPGTQPLEHTGVTLTFATVGDDLYRPGVVFKSNGDNAHCREIMQNILSELCLDSVIEAHMMQAKPKYVREILDEKMSPMKFILELMAIVMALVVIMSMMGLVGMSIHFTNERRNEIAVRRIFGATENGELIRNLKFYIVITAVALVPAVCIAELLRQAFGQFGIYPHNVWWIYVTTALLSFSFSMLSVLWQTLRAARTNPVEALKKE